MRMAQFLVGKGRVGAAVIFQSRFLVNTWVVEAHHHRDNAVVAAVEVHRRVHNQVVVARNTDRRLLVHLFLGLVSAICYVISEEIHGTHRRSNREEVRSRATYPAVVDNREGEVLEALLANDVAVEDHRIVVVDSSHYFQEAYVEVDNGAAVDIAVEVVAGVTDLLRRRLALPEEDRHCHFLRPAVSAACWFALPARVTLQSPFRFTD